MLLVGSAPHIEECEAVKIETHPDGTKPDFRVPNKRLCVDSEFMRCPICYHFPSLNVGGKPECNYCNPRSSPVLGYILCALGALDVLIVIALFAKQLYIHI